jgi:hypothetical protein
MVLGVHREVVARRVGWYALRQRPRDENAVAFAVQVSVQAPGMMFVNH